MEENIIYIGSKPVMNYVLAVVTQLNNGSKDVFLKARGKAISRAVDVAEIVRNRFVTDLEVVNISIATDQVENDYGNSTNVSTIEIHVRQE